MVGLGTEGLRFEPVPRLLDRSIRNQPSIDQGGEYARLIPKGGVDGVGDDARRLGDRADGGTCVAVGQEQFLGGVEDPGSRLRSLLCPDLRVYGRFFLTRLPTAA